MVTSQTYLMRLWVPHLLSLHQGGRLQPGLTRWLPPVSQSLPQCFLPSWTFPGALEDLRFPYCGDSQRWLVSRREVCVHPFTQRSAMSSLNTLGCAVLGGRTLPDVFWTSQCSFQGSTHWRHPLNSCTEFVSESPLEFCYDNGVIKFLGLRACDFPVCTAVHATAFSPSTCVQAVCLSLTCEQHLVFSTCLAISMCLERSRDVSTASFLSIPRALPKYHCSETAQPSYSIKSAALHRPCGPGLAPCLFSFFGYSPPSETLHSRFPCICWALYVFPLPQWEAWDRRSPFVFGSGRGT